MIENQKLQLNNIETKNGVRVIPTPTQPPKPAPIPTSPTNNNNQSS